MTSDLYVNLFVNETKVMSRYFGERLFCLKLAVEDRDKCLRQNVQASFFYQGAFSGTASISLGTSAEMGPHMPILIYEPLTQLTITRLPSRPKKAVVEGGHK